MGLRLFSALVGLAFFAVPGDAQELSAIKLPQGFTIATFAKGLGPARFMAQDPSGTLVVSVTRSGTILALPDRNGDGVADGQEIVLEGLDLPHGLAFHRGFLYVAETGRVLRYRYDPATMKAGERAVIIPNLPKGGGISHEPSSSLPTESSTSPSGRRATCARSVTSGGRRSSATTSTEPARTSSPPG